MMQDWNVSAQLPPQCGGNWALVGGGARRTPPTALEVIYINWHSKFCGGGAELLLHTKTSILFKQPLALIPLLSSRFAMLKAQPLPLQRFRGALLGTALGESLGTQRWLRLSDGGLLANQTAQPVADSQLPGHTPKLGQLIIAQIRGIIQGDRDPWQALISSKSATPGSEWGQSLSMSDAIVLMIPTMLAFHEDLNRLDAAIQQASADLQLSPESTAAVLTVGYAASLALRNQLLPTTVIARLIHDLELPKRYSHLAEQLIQVERLIHQRASLAIAIQQLTQGIPSALSNTRQRDDAITLLLALYCFLATPDDVRLTLLRAAQTTHQFRQTCAIAGFLSGVQNAIAGLPIHWRWQMSPNGAQTSLSALWGVSSEADLLLLADQLWATWTGVYLPMQPVKGLPFYVAVAAPNVIRPR